MTSSSCFDTTMYPSVRLTLAPLECLWSHAVFPASMFDDPGLELDGDLEAFLDDSRSVSLVSAVTELFDAITAPCNAPSEVVRYIDPVSDFIRNHHPSPNKRMKAMVTEAVRPLDRWLGTGFCLVCNSYLFWRRNQTITADRAQGSCCHQHSGRCLFPDCWFQYIVVPERSPRYEQHMRTNFTIDLDVFLPQRLT